MNHLLGTEANVRILRALATTRVPMSKAAIARRAALNPSGTARSVEHLTTLGIIESLGTGSRRLYQLRREQPLSSLLVHLFTAELELFEAVVDGIRAIVHRIKPPPRAAWIQGPVAAESDAPGDPIVVGILASAKSIDETAETLGAAVADLERTYDVSIPVHGLTSADIAALPEAARAQLEKTVPLLGPPPLELIRERHPDRSVNRSRSHEDLDRRALELARAVADRLSEDPTLIERAQRYVTRRLGRSSPRERQTYEEWDRVLRTMSISRLKRFLVEHSERATRLRQSLPFVDALSKGDRESLKESPE